MVEMEKEMQKKKHRKFRSITKRNMEEIKREQQLKYVVIVGIIVIALSI